MTNNELKENDRNSTGSKEQQTCTMKSPVYQVHIPGVGFLWFPEDDYHGAYQHATGEAFEDTAEENENESKISIVDFDDETEVPIVNV